ncbi:MAG: ribulokinase [Acidobacteriota bacterium]|nr:ribulokinase [Acidobacteriota bacterium]
MSSSDSKLSIGIDFGTLSGRVLVLDLDGGEELAAVEVPYAHGVIEQTLPDDDERLPPDWALQHPLDYVDVVERGVPETLARAGVDPARVIGIGVDFTSCTVLPTSADGTPLCMQERWRGRPHAWPKLWKHHAAQAQADRLTGLAQERDERFLARYGGRISSEWYFPKLLQIYEEDREVYDAAARFIEATDWIVWQLAGVERRCSCAASYKAFWSPDSGLPPAAYFEAAAAGFAGAVAKLGSDFVPLGTSAGPLEAELAQRLGLRAGVAVAVGNVDSFVSVPGAGVERPGTLVTVVGTSICDMVVHPEEILLPGITGVVRDGILPGLYGYESGQPAVGDMLSWYVSTLLGTEADARSARHDALERAAGELAPGASGLVALNWWNGNRSILADAGLSGTIAGLTLASTQAEIYRALLESIAFAARRIIDNFTEHGLTIDQLLACGGIAEKSPVLMQLFADIGGRPVQVPGSTQIPARGAAMFGAVAAGASAGGFGDITVAAERLRPATARSYIPGTEAHAIYNRVYEIYRGLHDTLGVQHAKWMHQLKRLRDHRMAA